MTILNLPTHIIHPVPMPRIHPYHLGASLYMPATRTDILAVIERKRLEKINSIIICLEDAVKETDVPIALANLQALLNDWQSSLQDKNLEKLHNRPLVFIRPRHAKMLHQLSNFTNIGLVDGFVLPKVDMKSLADWRLASQTHSDGQFLMPTLETAQIFHPTHNDELAIALTESFSQQILALRVGGNDLLSCLRMRRLPDVTLYESPLGTLIYRLLGSFVPYGFYLTSPVFEFLDKPKLFAQEIAKDVQLGLAGKTIIHPSQIEVVQTGFMVKQAELEQAQAILHTNAKAVFKQDNMMLEPATHKNWAELIVKRAEIFGTC